MRRVLSILLLLVAIACSRAGTHDGNDVVLLGDSNTWLGGDSCDNRRGWSWWFCSCYHPATCVSYARSGATWTNTPSTVRDITGYSETISDNNVIYNQIYRLVDAVRTGVQPMPELVVVMAGTNDAWFCTKRPYALSETADEAFSRTLPASASEAVTLASSVRLACDILMRELPSSRIVLITPMQSVSAGSDAIAAVSAIIADCGQRIGLPVIRLDTDGCVKADTERRHRTYTYDGNHTNTEGARCIGEYIARAIDNISDK